MNALVEDQLTRLRRALDSDEARHWCSEHTNGNRIYFGRYTGNTPVPGHEQNLRGNPDRRRIERLARELTDLDRGAMAAAEHAAQKEAEATTEEEREAAHDIIYFFPRLDGAEMRSRWDMQQSPPDILITNYSMLSIMLMREADSSIFEQTRQWLEQPGNVFHLIIDELHLYRGTSGTEVAYLLRLLLRSFKRRLVIFLSCWCYCPRHFRVFRLTSWYRFMFVYIQFVKVLSYDRVEQELMYCNSCCL